MAKKLGIVHCRICGGDIDRNVEVEGTDWFMKSKNWYYHVSCAKEMQTEIKNIDSKVDNEQLWREASYDFLTKDLKVEINYMKMNQQWKSFIKKGRTPKGIYFALKYFYEVKKGEKSKAQGGIGIVDYIYEESSVYWTEKENKEKGLIKKIEEQLELAEKQKTVVVQMTPRKKKKKNVPTLSEIGEEDISD